MRFGRTLVVQMKLMVLDPEKPSDTSISEVVDVLSMEGVIVYPTDTVYGLGCVLEKNPVARVYEMKGRPEGMPLSIAFSDMKMVRHYTVLGEGEEQFIDEHYRDPHTFIVHKNSRIPDFVTAGGNTVGVRIPDNEVCRRIIRRLGEPITTTSANISGRMPPASMGDLSREIADAVDLVVDSGACGSGTPSRIIDLTERGRVVR
ncbi:MAG: L-threonylcarbamoyladenylate synthase [Candidatus Altiarchaeota archaeon]